MKWSEVLSVINNFIFVIFRDLTRAPMIGIPLVTNAYLLTTIAYLLTNIAYHSVIGGHGIFNSGAAAMVSIMPKRLIVHFEQMHVAVLLG